MPKRNWWRRLCHDFLSRSRRSLPRRSVQPRFEPLEDRLTPANLHIDSVSLFATASASTSPVDGEWVTARVNYTTTDLDVNDVYDISFNFNGVTVNLNGLTDGAGLSTQSVQYDVGSWVMRPGTNSLTITLDVTNLVAEDDESATDNAISQNFTSTSPTTLSQKLLWPTAPQQADVMGVVNYVDTLPGSGAQDYRGQFFTTNGSNGIDIKAANFTTMDGGLPIYAVAGGTVTSVVDGNFDRRNTVTGSTANSITVDLGNGWTAIYTHLLASATTVKVGDTVTQGQLLGLMGSSGSSSDVTLHFQLEYNGSIVDPMVNLPGYFIDPLPSYQGDLTPYAEDSGVSNYSGDFQERPSSKATFATSESDDIHFWARISHLKSGDQLTFRWFRPDGTLDSSSTYNAGNERYGIYTATLSPGNWSQHLGKWEVSVSLAGTELARQSFQVVSSGAVPEILMHDAGGRLIPSGRTTPFDFGSVGVGGSGPTMNFSVQNHSSGTLNISSIDLPPGFSLVGSLPLSVAGNSSTTITLRLDSILAGAKFGAVVLHSSDADESSYSFNVKGT